MQHGAVAYFSNDMYSLERSVERSVLERGVCVERSEQRSHTTRRSQDLGASSAKLFFVSKFAVYSPHQEQPLHHEQTEERNSVASRDRIACSCEGIVGSL